MLTHTKNDSFTSSFAEVFSATGFALQTKGLLKYFIIPFIFNIILLTSVFYYAWSTTVPAVKGMLTGSEWYIQMLSMIVSPVIIILLAISTMIIYSTIGGIIAAPFLDILSQKTEECSGVENSGSGFSPLILVTDIFRALMNSVRLLLIMTMINLLLLILLILPGGSFIYAFTGFFTSIFFYGFQFFDFPLERIRLSFSRKLGLCWRWRRSVAGTGAAFFVLSFIPVVGFLGLNLCTVAATLTYIKKIRPSLINGQEE